MYSGQTAPNLKFLVVKVLCLKEEIQQKTKHVDGVLWCRMFREESGQGI